MLARRRMGLLFLAGWLASAGCLFTPIGAKAFTPAPSAAKARTEGNEPAMAARPKRTFPEDGSRQVIAVFVDGMSFADFAAWRTYPHVNKRLTEAAYGALTVRTLGARNEANAYLLMGSGGQAVYRERCGTAYQAGEEIEPGSTAGERMAQLDGSPIGGGEGDAILFPGIYRLRQENADKPVTARPGLLGATLRRAGIGVALYGNGDWGEKRQRHAALFAMDDAGRIPHGDVSARVNRKDGGYPYGIRTDYGYLRQRLEKDTRSGLIVVELADLARLHRMREMMEPQHFRRQYAQVLADLDAFVGELLQRRTSNRMVMVLSPAVNEAAKADKSLLTPVLLWEGKGAGGELTSATTRQPGVVSGLDILPTVLSWLSVPLPDNLAGHAMTGVPADEAKKPGEGLHTTRSLAAGSLAAGAFAKDGADQPVDRFLRRIERIDHIYRNRSAVMYAYAMLHIVILLPAAFVWGRAKREGRPLGPSVRRAVRLALLAVLFLPALFLLEPLLGWTAPPAAILAVILLVALAGATLIQDWPLPRLFVAVAGGTVAAILLDGFTGAEAMRRSYLGYDPVIGARFYGLGNEYEGVLIGAAILFASAVYEWRKSAEPDRGRDRLAAWLTLGVFATILYYMASPALGTNAGGFLAGTVGFGVAFFRLQGWRTGKTGLLLLAGGLLAGVLVLMAGSLASHEPLTHVGRVARQIASGDWIEVEHIVRRKLEMNLRLIRVSAWSKVFAVSLLVAALLSFRPDRYLRRLAGCYPYLVRGFAGVIGGSLAGLALNDSGIVSAATSILFFVVPALYAALGETTERTVSE